MIKSRDSLWGARLFLLGTVIAFAVGIFAGSFISPLIMGILALVGIVAGFFVSEKDVQTFLLASVSLVIVSYAGISGLVLGAAILGIAIGKIMASVLQGLLAMFVPATIVVALKTVFSISR